MARKSSNAKFEVEDKNKVLLLLTSLLPSYKNFGPFNCIETILMLKEIIVIFLFFK